jgi:adenosylhomocysteine nucleosidase
MPGPIIIFSADMEWRAFRELAPAPFAEHSPFGEWLHSDLSGRLPRPHIFFHGGWGKISAAASTQYLIDRWQPDWLVNLGTCGGFEGRITPGEVILAEQTIVYDILEQMGDPAEHIDHYSTRLDLSALGGKVLPIPVRRTRLVSADRDLIVEQIPDLIQQYDAIASDWESGAIAWTAARNGVQALILRAVTDLVGAGGGEAYADPGLFTRRTRQVMAPLLDSLPAWLKLISPPTS